ncbi:MAG: phenylpyruvate tautomerase MIF-related protein [Alphaproteobacteria bacterium]
MPFLLLKTNIHLDKTMSVALLNQASTVISRTTGKPEHYIMVNVCGGENLIFGGKSDPAVYMEMKSVGLPPDQVPLLADALTKMVESRLRVPANRVYIEFSSVPGNMWGYNGSTF